MANIEQLRKETDEITNSLKELKENLTLSEEEKKKEAERLKNQAEVTRQKIENEIKILESATDDESKKKKEEAELLLTSFNEITNLYTSIVGTGTTETTSGVGAVDIEKDKNIFTRGKEWVVGQWDNVWNKEKWKTEGGTNLLRTAGFVATGVGGVALAYKGIKSLWNRAFGSNKDKSKEETKKEEKPFWDRWYGKAIKYSVIGTGIYYVIHGLGTGQWNPFELFNWGDKGPDATSTTQDQVEGVGKLKEEDPEKFEKYKNLGENVDSQYNQLMDKEIKSGWGGMSIADGYAKYCDSSKLSLTDFKATVPMCIDNQFSSVSDMLSEGGYYAYLRSKNFSELKDVFMHMLTDGSQKLIGSIFPFFGCLKSFEKYKDKDFLESVKTWLDDGAPTERCEELQLFFRQYAKVVSYIQDKRMELIEKIAEKKLDTAEAAGEDVSKYATISDAINDSEWFENNIESDGDYQNFMQGKITHAIDVMDKESIFDDKLSEETSNIKESVDSLRSSILNEKDGKDTLDRLKENKGSLSEENYKEGLETADKVGKDIEDYFEKDWTYMYFGSAHTLINTEEKNKQEFLENSGLKSVKDGIKQKFLEYKTKFKDKTITPDEIDEYNTLVNSYFAMKKEVMVASTTIMTMKGNNASIVDRALNTGSAILVDFYNHTKKAWKELKDGNYGDAWLYGTFPLIAAGYALRKYGNPPKVFTISDGRTIYGVNKKLFAKQAKKLGDILLNYNALTIIPSGSYKLAGNLMRRTSHITRLPEWALLHGRYNIEHGDELLFQDVIEGRIGGTKAENIMRIGKDKWKIGKGCRSLEEFIQKMSGQKYTLTEKQIRDLYKTKVKIGGKEYDISFMKNETIKEKIIGKPTGTKGKRKKPINGYYTRYYNYSEISDNAKNLGFGELFGRSEGGTSKLSNLSENQFTFLKRIVEEGNFTDPAKQLKGLFENIDKIDLTDVSEEKLIRLIEELGTNPADLEHLAKIQSKIIKLKPVNIPLERLNQPIFPEIDNIKKELEDSLKNEKNSTKKTQIQKQINELDDFKREIGTMPDDEFKRMNVIVDNFRGSGTKKTLNEVITEVTKLKKIMDINGGSLTVGGGEGAMRVTKSIDVIIEQLDESALRQAKSFHSEIANELEDIAKIFEQIKVAKNANRISGNLTDIAKGIKILVKLARAA